MLSLEQLVTAPTEDEILATLLTGLGQLGFQATSWQSGSAQLIVLQLFARVFASLAKTIRMIAIGGFTSLAGTTEGGSPYLTLLARYIYDLERVAPQCTVGKILLTSSAGAPVHTIAVGDLIVADAEEGTDEAHTYTCTEGGTLNPGSTLVLEFRADVAGLASNIAPSTTLFLWTPLVGVTATNPALLPDSNTWITTPGEDEESDARLMARCFARWSRLTYGNINGAYEGWALEALPALTRVTVGSAPGDGNVRIIGATSLGPLTAPQCTEIEDYVNGVTDGVGRRPLNDIVSVDSAVVVTTPAINIDVYATSSVLDTIAAAMSAALLAYIGTIPIGGTRLQGNQGIVIYEELVRVAQTLPGVRKADFDLDEDIPLEIDEIYQPTINITVFPVAPGVA